MVVVELRLSQAMGFIGGGVRARGGVAWAEWFDKDSAADDGCMALQPLWQAFHSDLLVFDIVYNPQKTRLLADAEMASARTLGGLWMLVYQGVEAFKIWTGVEPSAETMYGAAQNALEAMRH